MRFTCLLIVSVLLFCVACAGGEKKTPENNSSKSTARDINLQAEDSNAAADDTKSTDSTSEKDQSPPMTKAQLTTAKKLIKKTSKKAVSAVKAEKVFKIRCASCHGFKGNMMVNGAKDLTKSNISLEESVAQVYFGKGLMTPFKGMMKDEEIVAVCRYIEELRK